jgi:hypothetical protein
MTLLKRLLHRTCRTKPPVTPEGELPFLRRFDATPGRKIELGDVGITERAVDVVDHTEAAAAVRRHARAEWGSAEERAANERALVENTRLRSVHHTASGAEFWVITKADRSQTMVLLPDEDE